MSFSRITKLAYLPGQEGSFVWNPLTPDPHRRSSFRKTSRSGWGGSCEAAKPRLSSPLRTIRTSLSKMSHQVVPTSGYAFWTRSPGWSRAHPWRRWSVGPPEWPGLRPDEHWISSCNSLHSWSSTNQRCFSNGSGNEWP